MHRLVLCINVYSYVAYLFYACSFSHNASVPIARDKNKYFLSLNKNTTSFYWVAGISNKNGMQLVYKLI